jgi:hypothetical protein
MPTATAIPIGGATGAPEIALGNRFYIVDALVQIFGPSASLPTTQLIKKNYEFGRSCEYWNGGTPYMLTYVPLVKDMDCYVEGYGGYTYKDTKIAFAPAPSVARESYIIRVCNKIVEQDAAVEYLAAQVSTTPSPTTTRPTAANIVDLYQVFYPGVTPNTAVKNALNALVADAMSRFSTSNPTLEAWRFLELAVCSSSGWAIK